MKKAVFLFVAMMAMAGTAFAGGYKSAGCGLGSLVIKDGGFIQVFAATTNGTFGSQTFGITSGTSNCEGSGGYVKAEYEQEMYVSSNFDHLSQEIAQGQGEHVNALASLMGCDKDSFSHELKKNWRTIATQDKDQLWQNVKSTVSSDPALQAACHNG